MLNDESWSVKVVMIHVSLTLAFFPLFLSSIPVEVAKGLCVDQENQVDNGAI